MGKCHQGEVYGVEWNHINKNLILSASSDHSIGLWDAQKGLQAGTVQKFAHEHTVYQAVWHPTHQ